MNPIALRLHEMGLQIEGCGMDEIVAALGVAEREIQRLDDESYKLHETLKDANDKCRSAFQIAKRITEQQGDMACGTNFGAFMDRVHESLMLQHVVLHPDQSTDQRKTKCGVFVAPDEYCDQPYIGCKLHDKHHAR